MKYVLIILLLLVACGEVKKETKKQEELKEKIITFDLLYKETRRERYKDSLLRTIQEYERTKRSL